MAGLPPHVYKTSNGNFRVRYRKSEEFPIPYDKTFCDKDVALEMNRQYLDKIRKKNYNQLKHIGFCDFCDIYIDWLRKKVRKLKPQTITSYIKYIDILKIAIGNKDVTTMDSLFLTNILDKESKRSSRANGASFNETISSNTLRHEYTQLVMLFKKMKLWGYIEFNPMSDIEGPIVTKKEIEVPEFEELDELETKIMTNPIRERLQFLMGLYMGMREEEVAGIHIDRDIDTSNLFMTVNTVIVRDENGEYIEDTPKSKSSIRSIPFPEKLLNVYYEYLKYRETFVAFLKYKNPNYKEIPNLFLSKDGGLYRPYRISRTWSKFAKANNIELTFHGLRHYYITNQMNYNEQLSDRDVQELAGHADIRTTQQYNHSSKVNIKKNAVNIFNKFSKDTILKKGTTIMIVPIEHIASIVLGKMDLSEVTELKITLEVLSNQTITFSNLSDIIKYCKTYILEYYPIFYRLEKFKHNDYSNDEIIKSIRHQFGKTYEIDKNLAKDT